MSILVHIHLYYQKEFHEKFPLNFKKIQSNVLIYSLIIYLECFFTNVFEPFNLTIRFVIIHFTTMITYSLESMLKGYQIYLVLCCHCFLNNSPTVGIRQWPLRYCFYSVALSLKISLWN